MGPCVGVWAREELATSFSLHRLASAGKALHQFTCPELLGGSSGVSRGGLAARVLGWAALVPGSVGGQAWCLGILGTPLESEGAWCLSLQSWA